MRIGLLSDTHDHVIRIRQAVALFNRAGVELVIHAGDWCSPFAVREFAALESPLHGILGNNDGDPLALARAFAEIGARIETQWWEAEAGDRKLLVMHEPRGVVDVAAAGAHDVVVYGHTHERDERRVGDVVIVNPGEACGWVGGMGSLAIYDAAAHAVEFHEL